MNPTVIQVKYFKCSDTGTGFKEKDTSQLFKAFYQDVQYKDHAA